MKLESLMYYFFGNNLIIGGHIKKQLAFLGNIVPTEWLNREMDDLGCGDGKATVLLKEILQPSKLRGFDSDQGLVRRARSKGIDAETINMDEDVPSGELAVVWGVLHHLKNPERCLQKLKENYPLVFIREPFSTGFIKGLELGHPMREKELTSLLGNHLPGLKMHYFDKNILAFYSRPDYL